MKKRHKKSSRKGTPVGPAEATQIGVRLHRTGRLHEAEMTYRRVLKAAPRQPDALHFLGMLAHQKGKSDEALRLIRDAVTVQPDYADAHNNLGNVLQGRDDLKQAEESYREAIRLNPRHADAHNNLGTVLHAGGETDAAIASYLEAIALAPELADAHHNLGAAYWQQGRAEEASSAYHRSLGIRPNNSEAYMALGRIFYRTGQRNEAHKVFQKWVENEPDDPIARHMVASCGDDPAPDRASDEYVRRTFDDFARSFDRSLKNLKYRAPQLIAGALRERFAEADRSLDVLDAGCGTGLCGPLLRPLARRLVGVDLSEGMLERARERGSYDELVAAELASFVARAQGEYDAIASADTLVYFGELEEVLKASARALRPGGWLLFSVEHLQDHTGADFRLEPHGRYCHSEPYVRRALESGGFGNLSLALETLRLEGGDPVIGLVAAAQAPGG